MFNKPRIREPFPFAAGLHTTASSSTAGPRPGHQPTPQIQGLAQRGRQCKSLTPQHVPVLVCYIVNSIPSLSMLELFPRKIILPMQSAIQTSMIIHSPKCPILNNLELCFNVNHQ